MFLGGDLSSRDSFPWNRNFWAKKVCGIAGIYEPSGKPVSVALLERMVDSLAHRGPDGRGIWTEPGIGLGHRRLAVRDLTDAGAQPFQSACGRVVVTYNGELYNENELARELARSHGFVRRTHCDTEIIPAGWLAWGMGLFDRLEGIYAIGLWDRALQQLMLARDAVGVKPLYVVDNGPVVRFASEVKALITSADGVGKIAAPDVASLLALGHVRPDRSILSGVNQVAPGTVRIFSGSERRDHRFWTPSRAPKLTSMEEAREEFVPLLRKVVSDQLVSDVPVGVLQSGGIDSSLISLALPRDANVRLYNVRFPTAQFDESAAASELAASAGHPLECLDLDDRVTDDEQDFRAVVHALDGSLADSSALAMYRLSRRVRSGATIALSGDGGDEIFAGYPTYRASALAHFTQPTLPRAAWRSLGRAFASSGEFTEDRVGRQEMLARLFTGLSAEVPHSAWRVYLYPWDRDLIYGAELKSLTQDPLGDYAQAFRNAAGDVWDKSLLADQRHYLPADMLMKVDRSSMAHALEVRVPFLDRRIMTFASRLDRRLLATYGGETKRLLRAAANVMGAPASITGMRKRGFNIPMNRLLAEGLKPLAERLLYGNPDILTPYCAADGVRRIWSDHRDGRVDRRYVIWTLLTLAVWREQTGI